MFRNVYKGKRVLVTGHTGFKGSWLCEWLLSLGAEVSGFSDQVPTKPSNFEAAALSSRLLDFRGDIRDASTLFRVFGDTRPEIVFHLAAQPLVRDSYDNPKMTFDTNVGGTVNVLEAIRSHSSVQAAVLVASDKCYENLEWEYGYREVDALGGKDPYSASKGAAEVVTSSYIRSFFTPGSGKRVGSARAGNVIGGLDWAKDRIVPDCIRAWKKGEKVLIRNPQSTRPWQHVLEPLSGYLAQGAALWEGDELAVGQAFNFGPNADANRTVLELLQELKKSWADGAGHLWEIDSNQVGTKREARFLKLVCEKANTRLDWRPTLSFSESVALTVQGYLSENSPSANQIREYVDLARSRGLSWSV